MTCLKKKKSTNLITGTEARKNPYFNMIEINKNIVKISKKYSKNVIRRQHAPKVYEMNASIYLWDRDYLLKNNKLFTKTTLFYEMPYERSVDIDNYNDFKIVKLLMNNEKKNKKRLSKHKTAYVIGGLGLLGKEISNQLSNEKVKVIILDIKDKPQKIKSSIKYEKFDLTNLKNIDNNINNIIKKNGYLIFL